MEIKGIRVELKGDNFNVVRETLERIGVCNHKNKTLYPSCYILQKRDSYFIMHFKNMFSLDGKESTLSEEDNLRQTAITKLLQTWGLITILDQENVIQKDKYPNVFVLPHNKKGEYIISHKYRIGSVKG